MKRLRSSMGLGSVPLSRLMVPRSFLRVASPSFAGLGRGEVFFSEAATANVEASSLPSNVQLDTATQAYLKKEALLEQSRTLYQDLALPNKRLPVLSFETGQPTGEYFELPDTVFSTPLRTDIIHRNIVWQEKNARTTLYKGKKRSEVRGGGRKPYKQKGTGRSRQGSIRSPLWVGGGMAHPPKLKTWGTRLQKKVRRLGMRVALAAKYRDLRLVVVQSLSLPLPKTRAGAHALLHHGVAPGKRVLFVDALAPSPKSPFTLATRNIPGCKTLPALAANVRDIVLADRLFITVEGLKAVIERVTKED